MVTAMSWRDWLDSPELVNGVSKFSHSAPESYYSMGPHRQDDEDDQGHDSSSDKGREHPVPVYQA